MRRSGQRKTTIAMNLFKVGKMTYQEFFFGKNTINIISLKGFQQKVKATYSCDILFRWNSWCSYFRESPDYVAKAGGANAFVFEYSQSDQSGRRTSRPNCAKGKESWSKSLTVQQLPFQARFCILYNSKLSQNNAKKEGLATNSRRKTLLKRSWASFVFSKNCKFQDKFRFSIEVCSHGFWSFSV